MNRLLASCDDLSPAARRLRPCVLLGVAMVWLAACGNGDGLDTDAGTGGSQGGSAGTSTGGSGGASECGPVCDIYCEFGNVLDDKGCPTCSCKPSPKECRPEECPGVPAIAFLCPDGSAVGFTCKRQPNGQCAVVQEECPVACPLVDCLPGCSPTGVDVNGCQVCRCDPGMCAPDSCGPPPPVAPCPNGQGPSMECKAGRDLQCRWEIGSCPVCDSVLCAIFCPFGHKRDANGCDTCQCNEPPACSERECGPAPKLPSFMCSDGSTAGPVCDRNLEGKCSWSFRDCPRTCADFRDLRSCEVNSACQWLEPGCSGNRLPVAGCFEKRDVGCENSRACRDGKQCVTRTVDHCAGRPDRLCITCASPTNVCL